MASIGSATVTVEFDIIIGFTMSTYEVMLSPRRRVASSRLKSLRPCWIKCRTAALPAGLTRWQVSQVPQSSGPGQSSVNVQGFGLA